MESLLTDACAAGDLAVVAMSAFTLGILVANLFILLAMSWSD